MITSRQSIQVTPIRARSESRALRAATRMLVWVALLVVGNWPGLVAAHELRPAIATLDMAEDRLTLVLSLNLEAAIAGIGPGHETTEESEAAPVYDRLRGLDQAALGVAFESFAARLANAISLTIDGARVPLTVDDVVIPEVGDIGLARVSEVMLSGPAQMRPEMLEWRLDEILGDSVIRLRDSISREIVRADYVAAGTNAGPLMLDSVLANSWDDEFVDYLELGFVHIVPKGLDHILFVVGLFLLSTRLSSLMWQISAFTLAHTVTLALGVTGTISLPPEIVEPLIAASIAYVAIENLVTDRLHRWRPAVVFGFGLLHGLGFAGVLGEIGLSPGQLVTGLVAFNIGVELGQLVVIAACFVAVGLAVRRTWYRHAVTMPASLAIAGVATYWMVERTGLA